MPRRLLRVLRRFVAATWSLAVIVLLAGCESPTLNVNPPPWLGGTELPAPARPTDVTKPPPPPPRLTPPVPPAPPSPVVVVPVTPREVAPQPRPAAPRIEAPDIQAAPPPTLTPPAFAGSAPVKIALLVPLSGRAAEVGRALLDAAQLALFDVGGERLVLMPKDTVGEPEGARAAIQEALEEGAQLVLGPLFSASVTAAAEPARERGVNIIAFSTDRTTAGNGVYLMGIMPEQQIDRVVSFARSQGLTRLAALVPTSAYGETILDALRRAALRHGARLVQVEFYAPDLKEHVEPILRLADYHRRRAALEAQRRRLSAVDDEAPRRALRRLEGLDTLGKLSYDALLVPEGGEALRALAPLLAFYDVDPDKIRFLGTALWDSPKIGREPSLVGGWFTAPTPAESSRFQARFETMYGRPPPRIASLAYDAMALAAVLAHKRNGPDFSAAALASPSGFAGATAFSGSAPMASLSAASPSSRFAPRSLRVINPAPTTFQKVGS